MARSPVLPRYSQGPVISGHPMATVLFVLDSDYRSNSSRLGESNGALCGLCRLFRHPAG